VEKILRGSLYFLFFSFFDLFGPKDDGALIDWERAQKIFFLGVNKTLS